jgi:hypothetical protein
MDDASHKQEGQLAWGTVVAGLLLAVMIWGGSHPMTFVVTWGPQAAVLLVMFFIGARPAAIAGAALGFAGYLAFFKWWMLTYHPTDGMVWLIYLFSLPGGILAGLLVAMRMNRRDGRPTAKACLTAAAVVIAGTAVNQLSVHIALSS